MTAKAKKLLEEGSGVFRLAPVWVPRAFCRPAKRIKLHPEDYYVLGQERGGIRIYFATGQRQIWRMGDRNSYSHKIRRVDE